MKIFMIVLFLFVKSWKDFRNLLKGEWINNVLLQSGILYSSENEFLLYVIIGMSEFQKYRVKKNNFLEDIQFDIFMKYGDE